MRGGRPHKGESRALLPRVRGERSMCTPLTFGECRSRSATTWRSRRYEGRSTTRTTRSAARRRLTPSLSPRWRYPTQDGDVPSERRALRALEEAEALCRRMRRAKSADDGERGALMRATRACERLVEKVEAAKLRTVRVKERRRQFSLLLDVQSQLDALDNCGKFAQLVREQAPDLRGCTVLVPTDDAFLGDDDAFEDDCWGVHVIDGPWKMGDMAVAGRVLGRHVDTRHGIRTVSYTHLTLPTKA